MTSQIADVTKPLASAGRIIGKWHRIVLGGEDVDVQRKATGRRVTLRNRQLVCDEGPDHEERNMIGRVE